MCISQAHILILVTIKYAIPINQSGEYLSKRLTNPLLACYGLREMKGKARFPESCSDEGHDGLRRKRVRHKRVIFDFARVTWQWLGRKGVNTDDARGG
jgi:hypothetical protein